MPLPGLLLRRLKWQSGTFCQAPQGCTSAEAWQWIGGGSSLTANFASRFMDDFYDSSKLFMRVQKSL
jgi:hypothetical protein